MSTALGEIRLERASPTPLDLQLAENIRKLMAEGCIRKCAALFREGLLSRRLGPGTDIASRYFAPENHCYWPVRRLQLPLRHGQACIDVWV